MFMSPESLSPHLSSIESLKASLPEKHRHLFDSLLQDIKDYCASHDLPTPSLTSREAFITAAQKNRTPPDVLNHIILLLKRFDYLTEHKEPMPEKPISLTQEEARKIMDLNFLGTKEVEEHFGELSLEQQEALSIIPFSKETLEECKDTHILVADIGLSIVDIGKLEYCKELFYDGISYFEKQSFATDIEQPSWRLIRKTPVEDSIDKTWEGQQALLNPQTDEVPSARQVVYTITLHFCATGYQLFENFFVRTNDVDPNDNSVSIGQFNMLGFLIRFHSKFTFDEMLGLASTRKALSQN
jgi:hypothetical protein